jgi:hypothetical protein
VFYSNAVPLVGPGSEVSLIGQKANRARDEGSDRLDAKLEIVRCPAAKFIVTQFFRCQRTHGLRSRAGATQRTDADAVAVWRNEGDPN